MAVIPLEAIRSMATNYEETGKDPFVEKPLYQQWYFVENSQMRVFIQVGTTQFKMTNVPANKPVVGDAILKTIFDFNREQYWVGINRKAVEDVVFWVIVDNQIAKRVNQLYHFIARIQGKNPLEVMNTRAFWVGTIEGPNRRLNPDPKNPPPMLYFR